MSQHLQKWDREVALRHADLNSNDPSRIQPAMDDLGGLLSNLAPSLSPDELTEALATMADFGRKLSKAQRTQLFAPHIRLGWFLTGMTLITSGVWVTAGNILDDSFSHLGYAALLVGITALSEVVWPMFGRSRLGKATNTILTVSLALTAIAFIREALISPETRPSFLPIGTAAAFVLVVHVRKLSLGR